MKVIINGGAREIAPDATVATVLEAIGVRSEGVAVAVNYECVVRAAYATTRLHDGDEVEILAPHQGG